MTEWHLAQLNIGRLRAPFDDPSVAEFVDGLDAVNAIADTSPGFVWRLQSDAGNATDIRISDDDRLAVNLTVWESVDSLRDFVFRSDHVGFLRRRAEWFERPERASMVLWWVPAGHIPSIDEALGRLDLLDRDGSSPEAFTFRDAPAPPA